MLFGGTHAPLYESARKGRGGSFNSQGRLRSPFMRVLFLKGWEGRPPRPSWPPPLGAPFVEPSRGDTASCQAPPSPFVLLFHLDFTWARRGAAGAPSCHPCSHPAAAGHFCGAGSRRKAGATSMETKACFQTVLRETVSILGL